MQTPTLSPTGDSSPRQKSLPCTLVTGASSGIGYEIARQLAHDGTQVIALGRDARRIQDLAAQSANIAAVIADLSELDGIPALVARLVTQHPDLAIVINNAGIQHELRFDSAANDAGTIRREIDINLSAPLLLAHALWPQLCSQPDAALVNVTSGLAYAPKRTAAVYSATKAGLHLFTEALRVQHRPSGPLAVEVVLPLVDTPMTQGRGRGKISARVAAAELIAGLKARRPVIRVGKTRALPLLLRVAPSLFARMLQKVD